MSAIHDSPTPKPRQPGELGLTEGHDGTETRDPLAEHAVDPSEAEGARLAALFGPLPDDMLGLLARYERLHADAWGPGFAGAMLAAQIRRRFPAETAALDVARRARREAADHADPTRPLRRALERLRHTLASEAAKAERAWRERAERVAEIDGLIAALDGR